MDTQTRGYGSSKKKKKKKNKSKSGKVVTGAVDLPSY